MTGFWARGAARANAIAQPILEQCYDIVGAGALSPMIWARRLLAALALGLALASGWQVVALWRAGGWWVERAEDKLGAGLHGGAGPRGDARARWRNCWIRGWPKPRATGMLSTRFWLKTWPCRLTCKPGSTLPARKISASRQRPRACWACSYDLSRCTLGPDLACGIGDEPDGCGRSACLGPRGAGSRAGRRGGRLDLTWRWSGVAATGAVVFTGGTSYTVKAGPGCCGVAHRMGRLAPDLRRPPVYIRAFREGVDWAALSRGAPLGRATRTDALTPAIRLTKEFGAMRASAGTRATLHLMGAAQTVPDARAMARTAVPLARAAPRRWKCWANRAFCGWACACRTRFWALAATLSGMLSALGGLIAGRALRLLRRRL